MKAIVITSIFLPTEAIKKFSEKEDYIVFVVGDKKTPANWAYPKVKFISIDQQLNSSSKLAKIIPVNHYCRKMLGYIFAIQNQAEVIYDTDDDNIPYDNWDFPQFNGENDYLEENLGFINIYQLYTEQKIWPRGLPLKRINYDCDLKNHISKRKSIVGIWQGLADEDPDVDAIYRLTYNSSCYFQKREPIILGKGTISPFNTQNTLIRKELFPLLYLPTYVTFRYTDILRGLIAQPIMWSAGFLLGFTNATVIQKRNPHDYMKDFVSEIPMYETCEKVIELVIKSIHGNNSIENNLYNAYDTLILNNIVDKREIEILETWLNEI